MKLSDLILDENAYTFLCGESCASREFQEIHIVTAFADLFDIRPGSLLFLMNPLFTDNFTPDMLLSKAVHGKVVGLVFLAESGLTLTRQQQELLSANAVFVLLLPPSADFHRIFIKKLQMLPEVYQSSAVTQIRADLYALSSKPYTALDVASLVNRALGRSVDLVVGPELRALIQHDTLGIVNVPAIISDNLARILSSSVPQIYYTQNRRALVVRIMDLYAFVAIPLQYERSISELEIAMTMEAIPYLAVALSQEEQASAIHSAEDLYFSILRGTHSFNPLSLRETASFLGINCDLPRYVWILEWQDSIPVTVYSFLKKKISERFPASVIHDQERRLVMISPSAELRSDGQSPVAVFRQLLQDYWQEYPHIPFCISFSKPCSGLRHLKKAYNEAKFSMIIGPKLNPKKHIHDFQSYILYQALCNRWGSPILDKVHASIIVPIRRYDEEYNLSLLPTLEQYAACAFNITRATEAMQVHRNTLYRRIAKIGSILNRDMSTSDTHILLYIALRIDHIIQIFPQTEKNMSWTL